LSFRLFSIITIIFSTVYLNQANANNTYPQQNDAAIATENKLTKKPAPQQDKLLTEQELIDQHWTHKFHQSVSDSVFQSAVWFDNFFVDESNEYESPKTSARIRLGWKPKARDWNDVEARFRIKVKLPHFKNKMDLILSDEDETDQNQLPLESINSQSTPNEEHFAAAVRYTHSKNKNRLLESRVGFSSGDLFFKVRHKRRFSINEHQNFRVEPSVYYLLGDGLGAKLLLEYNYQLNSKAQFRVNYSVRGSEEFQGIRWKHGFYRLNQLGDKTASIIGFQAEGVRNNQQGFLVDKYTLSYRYRFNALREWLYFEVEPFVEWPEEQHYTTTPGIALRIEGYFNKG